MAMDASLSRTPPDGDTPSQTVPEADPLARSVELVPARMINEFVYCPRLFYLEWVDREWASSADTLAGQLVHRRIEDEGGSLPPPEELDPEDRISARSVLLADHSIGMIARLDLLEGSAGTVRPVDYKKGSPGPEGPWEPDVVQLCAQALILRGNGYQCDDGVLYYAATRQRFVIRFDDSLVARTLDIVSQLREAARAPIAPPPLIDSPKCPRCSLVGICLPDEVSLLRGTPMREVRRLVPARDDAQSIYIIDQGATVGRNGERLVIRRRDGSSESIRLLDVAHVSLYGNVQISAQALRCLAERDIPVLHHTYGGWLIATTTSTLSRNADLRAAQHRCADDPIQSLRIAQSIVVGKLRNQRTMLRRNSRSLPDHVLAEMTRCTRLAQQARSIGRLFGVEGMAARIYFGHFASMLRDSISFDITARDRRPPPDPVNAVLSFLYALLVKDAVRALLAVGLDPYRGIYHQLRLGRPSLALDLMEEFRPLIADSTALTLFNNKMLGSSDFLIRGRSCALLESSRRRVIESYEHRMDTLVRHPLFGYQVSYRRILEIQARLLARAISGELPAYRPFITR
jgi:CRISPR-associated protein Cas1